jgi:hypothetical protein
MSNRTLVDPLGRQLTLYDSGWFGHVLKRHPEMRLLRSFVEQAVERPLQISFSTSDLGCRLYYGLGPSRGMMVVVVGDLMTGWIRTAYKTSRMKGVIEWQP